MSLEGFIPDTRWIACCENAAWYSYNLHFNEDGEERRHFEGNFGINTNNRLIWGQVFFWPEARVLGHDRDVLWNDTQVFETRTDYDRFRKAVGEFYKVWKDTAVDLPVRYH